MKAPPQETPEVTEVPWAKVGEKTGAIEIERPLGCAEAAELLGVHPKTIKRMAGRGELPGHFRFGRWYFYPSELDSWMRGKVHSSGHSCR
jgi:excisionase family DNA binding protein